jgi:general secretion pathway protein L
LFDKYISIDIGTTSVKLLAIKRSINKTEIVTYDYKFLNTESESLEEEISKAINELIIKVPTDQYRIITTYPMEFVFLRKLKFPFSDIPKISEVLPFEAEELLPYNLEDAKLDFQILNSDDDGSEVLASSVFNQNFEQHTSYFTELQYPLAKIGLEANALFYQLYDNPGTPQNYIQCEIGFNKTVIVFIKEKKMIASRCIPQGLVSVIEKIAEFQKLTVSEAAGLFENLHFDLESEETNYATGFYKSLKISKKNMGLIYTSAVELFDEIATQISVTHNAITETHISSQNEGEKEFQKLYISGGAAYILRILDFFTGATGIETSRPPSIPGMSDPSVQNSFSICYGMISEALHNPQTIDFLNDKLHSKQESFDLTRYYPTIFFGVIAIIVFISALLLNLFFTVRADSIQREALSNHFNTLFKQQLTENEEPIVKARELLKSERDELNAIENILPSSEKAIEILDTLTSYFPDDETFILENLTVNNQSITVRGTSENSENLDSYKNTLSELGRFESVNLNTNASSGNTVNFTLIIKLKENSSTQGNN